MLRHYEIWEGKEAICRLLFVVPLRECTSTWSDWGFKVIIVNRKFAFIPDFCRGRCEGSMYASIVKVTENKLKRKLISSVTATSKHELTWKLWDFERVWLQCTKVIKMLWVVWLVSFQWRTALRYIMTYVTSYSAPSRQTHFYDFLDSL